MKCMKSRAKKEGKRKVQRRKEKQQEEGAKKLLIKLFKEDMEEKALFNTEDLDENPEVRPKMDLQYYNILLEHGIFLEWMSIKIIWTNSSGGKREERQRQIFVSKHQVTLSLNKLVYSCQIIPFSSSTWRCLDKRGLGYSCVILLSREPIGALHFQERLVAFLESSQHILSAQMKGVGREREKFFPPFPPPLNSN